LKDERGDEGVMRGESEESDREHGEHERALEAEAGEGWNARRGGAHEQQFSRAREMSGGAGYRL
jgi:hypothetical protein